MYSNLHASVGSFSVKSEFSTENKLIIVQLVHRCYSRITVCVAPGTAEPYTPLTVTVTVVGPHTPCVFCHSFSRSSFCHRLMKIELNLNNVYKVIY